MEITNKTNITKENFSLYFKSVYFRLFFKSQIIVTLLMLGIFALLVFLMRNAEPFMKTIILIIVFLSIIFSAICSPILIRYSFKIRLFTGDTVCEYVFFDNYLDCDKTQNEIKINMKVNYSDIYMIAETEKVFFLQLRDNRFLVIDKDQFIYGTESMLRNLFASANVRHKKLFKSR